MAKATDDSAQNPRSVTLRLDEIHNLSDRLAARAQSILLRNEPEQARDILMASRVIRVLTRHINPSDLITIENGA
jgi:hypothetical protein